MAMPSDRFDLMLGKALTDEKYRDKLMDPKTRTAALQEIGIKKPTQKQLQGVQNAVTALESLSGLFGEGTGAA